MFDGLDTDVRCFYVGNQWPVFAERLRPHIAKMAAGSGGRFEAEDIVACIECGRFHLWLMLEGSEILAALLTEIVQYPRLRAMRGIAVVGHRHRRWVEAGHAAIEMVSKQFFGCDRMEAMHQPGHERLLTPYGYEVFHYLSQKPL